MSIHFKVGDRVQINPDESENHVYFQTQLMTLPSQNLWGEVFTVADIEEDFDVLTLLTLRWNSQELSAFSSRVVHKHPTLEDYL